MSGSLYRFLLVDDEEIITEGISQNINWEQEGFEFLPPCSDGLEAIESIKKNKPDIVLTDICMPGVDGLEVAKFIYEYSPDTLTLILSGYDEFEYAQQAMSLNVIDFLLKPISSRSLKKQLEKIRKLLQRRDEKAALNEHLLELVEKSRRAVSDRYLSRLISGNIVTTDSDLLCDDLIFLDRMDYFSVICLEIDNHEQDFQPDSISSDILFLTMEEACSNSLLHKDDWAKIATADNRIVIILGRHSEQTLSRETLTTAAEILDSLQKQNQTTASAGIGQVVRNIKDIYISYRQAVSVLQQRLFGGDSSIFVYKPGESSNLELRLAFTKCSDEMRRNFRIGRKDENLRICEDFIRLLQSENMNPNQARREIIKFISVILEVSEEIGIAEAEINGISFSEFLYKLMDAGSLNYLDKMLSIFIHRAENVLEEKRDSFPRKKLNEITEYISKNYTESSLSVENVAEKFFISSGYLTKLFRQNLNQTFVEFVTQKKMEHALELLKTSDLKNYLIAEKLGFKDPHYFSSSFKKYYGKTPSEYKNSL